VNPNSLAERCGIRDDDYILKIGPISAEYLQHHDAQEHIKRQNNILELILQRSIKLIKENKKENCFYFIEDLHQLLLIITVV
jgi:C-terminal processing protease CtpA/Prc